MQVAVVGGGRRGKTLCKVLAGLRAVEGVHLVSRRNARGMQDWIAGAGLAGRVSLHGKLDPVLWDPAIQAAVVANAPAEHFSTARWLLENAKHVLVERPFVPTCAEAQALIGMAEARGLVLAAQFEYFLASYVHYFRSVVHDLGHPHPVERTAIIWHEPMLEERWGPTGCPELANHVVAELLPHVLTLLTVLFGRQAVRATRMSSASGHLTARLELAYGSHPVRVALSRVAAGPRRAIAITTRSGRRFMLDFTREPGTVTLDGRPLEADPSWDALPRPLPAAMAYFFDEIRERQGTLPLLAKAVLHIVEGTEQAVARAKQLQPVPAPRVPLDYSAFAASTPSPIGGDPGRADYRPDSALR